MNHSIADATAHDDAVLGDVRPEQVRVRFPPSPTGNLHVGNVRSALFNWAFARHYGGKLVLRIEDTDTARSTQESMRGVLESLRWLGLDWDEGPEVGGAYGPYIQSERGEIYRDVAEKLLAGGHAYHCYCSREELEQRDQARQRGELATNEGCCRDLSPEQESTYREQGRTPVIRVRMPDRPIVFDDLVRGEVVFNPENVPDYVIVRANGEPLYTLTNPLDDALMGITHVLRGEDLLSSTPRQIVLYEALAELGIGSGRTPRFGHLPIVMGEGNRRLSKRDKGAGLAEYRERGFLPEGLLNYLALLGWSISEDRDVFTMAEMIEAFSILRVNASPARFDLRKCEAINGSHIRMLPVEELARRLVPFLVRDGLVTDPPSAEEEHKIIGITPIIRERLVALSDAGDMSRFMFTPDDEIEIEDKARLKPEDAATLDAAAAALNDLDDFSAEPIQQALRSALVEGMGLKPKFAFGPVRTAISGRKVSPPLFESMEILGRQSSLRRITRARAGVDDSGTGNAGAD